MPGSILLINPFRDECDLYAQALKQSGFNAIECDNVTVGLTLAREWTIAAVVARIRQEGQVDGIELTRRIKHDRRTTHVPVVLITTHVAPGIRAAALAAGCDRYLLLPVLPDVLAAELQALVGHAPLESFRGGDAASAPNG